MKTLPMTNKNLKITTPQNYQQRYNRITEIVKEMQRVPDSTHLYATETKMDCYDQILPIFLHVLQEKHMHYTIHNNSTIVLANDSTVRLKTTNSVTNNTETFSEIRLTTATIEMNEYIYNREGNIQHISDLLMPKFI